MYNPNENKVVDVPGAKSCDPNVNSCDTPQSDAAECNAPKMTVEHLLAADIFELIKANSVTVTQSNQAMNIVLGMINDCVYATVIK